MQASYLDFQESKPSTSTVEKVALYDKLVHYGLARKIIEISLNETKTPHSLHEDAAQEIRMAWAKAKAKPEFSQGETASYAHRIAVNTCRKVQRDLGSAVRLPGSAFRKRRDGTSYVTPGVLSAPLDWAEVEERLNRDGGDDELSDAMGWCADAFTAELDSSHVMTPVQMAKIKRVLNDKQWLILTHLLTGGDVDSLQRMLETRRSSVVRQITMIRKELVKHGLAEE